MNLNHHLHRYISNVRPKLLCHSHHVCMACHSISCHHIHMAWSLHHTCVMQLCSTDRVILSASLHVQCVHIFFSSLYLYLILFLSEFDNEVYTHNFTVNYYYAMRTEHWTNALYFNLLQWRRLKILLTVYMCLMYDLNNYILSRLMYFSSHVYWKGLFRSSQVILLLLS